MLGRGEDLRPVVGERHGCRAERAADLAHGRGTHDPVVAVGVVAGDLAELVAGGLGGLLVVGGGLVRGGVAGERAELEKRRRRGGCRGVRGRAGADPGPAGPGAAQRDGPGPASRWT